MGPAPRAIASSSSVMASTSSSSIEMGFLSTLVGNPTWDLVNGDLVIKGPRGTARLARSL